MQLIGRKNVLDWIRLDNNLDAFYQIYTDQKKAIWFPEEINISQDIKDYESLSDEERWLFNELVWYFVTTELLVQNVLGESFYPYIIHPRAKMAMTVQMFMEDIHSDFFEMVLNTFSMDRDAMYNKTLTNPILKKKQEMVASAANKISISNSGWVDADSLEWKKSILKAILYNNIIQEWIFFYSAFALYFAMRETWKMKFTNNWLDLILIDESFHLKLWIELILWLLEQNPEMTEDEEFVNWVQQAIVDWTELELEFLQSLLQWRSIFNVSYNEMANYLRYIADRRLNELGFDSYYGVEKNPLKFLEKQDLMTLQNFFEVTPNQYTNF